MGRLIAVISIIVTMGKIHQIWKRVAPLDVLHYFIENAGVRVNQEWTKADIERMNGGETIIKNMGNELRELYIDCKVHLYYDKLPSVHTVITILKQLCRLHGYVIHARESNCQTKKIMKYTIRPPDYRDGIKIIHQKHVISFN